MSTPVPGGVRNPKGEIQKRHLRPNETFEDVISGAPQVPRPLLMASVDTFDQRSFLLNNKQIVSWNGVIIEPDTEEPDNTQKWVISEPFRRLDGTIIYGDKWERLNNGDFRGPSGIMIEKDLTLVHRNGFHIYPDGTTYAPSGKIIQGNASTVGIIYRPGTSDVVGIQHHTIQEPPMDPNIKMETADFRFEPSKFAGELKLLVQLIISAVVPQIAVNPWEDISRARIEVVTDYVQQEMYPRPHPSFLPRPSARSASRPNSRASRNSRSSGGGRSSQSSRRGSANSAIRGEPNKIMTLNLDQLHEAIPEELQLLVLNCDMDGCDTDYFGIPLCLPVADRLKILPYAKEALRKLNHEDSLLDA